MSESLPRRRFLKQAAGGFGMTVVAVSTTGWLPPFVHAQVRRTPSGDLLETMPPGKLPSFVSKKDAKVQEVYRYATAHGEVLQYIPCFCGCGNIGHRHNADCYVAERLPGGYVTFTSHGAM